MRAQIVRHEKSGKKAYEGGRRRGGGNGGGLKRIMEDHDCKVRIREEGLCWARSFARMI